ncbi:MAG TPA: lasso RiPP family leader peptide-containing protein [Ktedonobacterales bacterium]
MRKPYRKPRLRRHGKLSELTQGIWSFHNHHDVLH